MTDNIANDLPVLTSAGFTVGTMIISDSMMTALLNAAVTLLVAVATVWIRESKTNRNNNKKDQ